MINRKPKPEIWPFCFLVSKRLRARARVLVVRRRNQAAISISEAFSRHVATQISLRGDSARARRQSRQVEGMAFLKSLQIQIFSLLRSRINDWQNTSITTEKRSDLKWKVWIQSKFSSANVRTKTRPFCASIENTTILLNASWST